MCCVATSCGKNNATCRAAPQRIRCELSFSLLNVSSAHTRYWEHTFEPKRVRDLATEESREWKQDFVTHPKRSTALGKSRKYSTGQKTVFTNYTESEPIWMKSGALWAHCWGWPRQILGAIHTVATVWDAAEIFCQVNNPQRRSVSLCKLSEQNFEKFTIRGRFSKKTQKLLKISRSCDFRPS